MADHDELSSSAKPPLTLIVCGALAGHVREIIAKREWRVELLCLPGLLHNRPKQIAPEVERLAVDALSRGRRVAVGYADCGTYSVLDEVCSRLRLARLPGLHCYDLYAGETQIRSVLEAEPGTYILTDYLIRIFDHTVMAELGLDRYPDLWHDYFGNYRRLIWLAQRRDANLTAEADRIAAMFGLPLTVIDTGTTKLEAALEQLLAEGQASAAGR
jgi:uncharacterized protein DUF1638